ncbi:TPA: DnaJ subfamily C member 9 [Trebouxia sp. C0006]
MLPTTSWASTSQPLRSAILLRQPAPHPGSPTSHALALSLSSACTLRPFRCWGLGSSRPSRHCITEAYKKLSMRHHPDRVPQDQKEVATKLFKLLSVAKKQLTS